MTIIKIPSLSPKTTLLYSKKELGRDEKTKLKDPVQLEGHSSASSLKKMYDLKIKAMPIPKIEKHATYCHYDLVVSATHIEVPVIPNKRSDVKLFSPSSGDHQKNVRHYKAHVKDKIKRFYFYPKWAQQQGLEGSVSLHFIIYQDGQVGAITVVSSTQSKLNESAVALVQQCSPFQAFPRSILKQKLIMTVVLHFILNKD